MTGLVNGRWTDKKESDLTVQKNRVPDSIQVRNARVHNLKNIDVDIPLHQIVGIAGRFGSGKSSLAWGFCTQRGQGVISMRFPLIPAAG